MLNFGNIFWRVSNLRRLKLSDNRILRRIYLELMKINGDRRVEWIVSLQLESNYLKQYVINGRIWLSKEGIGCVVAQWLDAGFPPRRPGFACGQHVGFVVGKAALGQVFSEYSVSPAKHSTDFSIIIITRGWHNRPLSGRSVEWTLISPPAMQI
jgi:hypothetical protein